MPAAEQPVPKKGPATRFNEFSLRAEDEDMTVKEMLAYFGLYSNSNVYKDDDRNVMEAAIEELEDIIVDEDIDVELDNQGKIVSARAAKLREPLFKEHERRVGHRPDDKHKMKEERDKQEREKKERDERRQANRARLARRVKKRQAARRADAGR